MKKRDVWCIASPAKVATVSALFGTKRRVDCRFPAQHQNRLEFPIQFRSSTDAARPPHSAVRLASPWRALLPKRGYASIISRRSLDVHVIPVPERHSLSALWGGKAANQSIINTTFPKLSFDSILS